MKILETFKCSGQTLSNSSCQLWNDKSIPLQILHHSSLSWHITPLWILSSYFFYFGLKDPIKIPILRLSIALVKICIFLMSFSKSQVSFSSNFASPFSVIKDNSSVFFYVKHWIICTIGTNSSANFGNFTSAGVKFYQILVIFETTDEFSSIFSSIFRVMWHNSSVLLC